MKFRFAIGLGFAAMVAAPVSAQTFCDTRGDGAIFCADGSTGRETLSGAEMWKPDQDHYASSPSACRVDQVGSLVCGED